MINWGICRILVGVIRGYQLGISPFMTGCCRFTPTCSEYAKEALTTCGVFRGLGRVVWRLLRCHPGCSGGYDPVIKDKC